MQFTNTSGVPSQTDTTQHNAGGELHARLRNDEQHTSTPGPAGVEGAGGTGGPDRGAGGRRPSLSTHKRQARPIGGAARPAGPGRASRSTTPSEARVWRSRGRAAAHRHQHAGTNTQPQTHRHNEAARPHRGRAAHASGRYAAISEVFSASGCRWRPGARRPRRRGRPCRPRPTCPTYAGRTAS